MVDKLSPSGEANFRERENTRPLKTYRLSQQLKTEERKDKLCPSSGNSER